MMKKSMRHNIISNVEFFVGMYIVFMTLTHACGSKNIVYIKIIKIPESTNTFFST